MIRPPETSTRAGRLVPGLGIAIIMASAAIFMVASSTRLEAQGLQADEVHQAVPAFAYLGDRPPHFATLAVADIPVLNMPYSGALKTAIYGLYLRLFDQPFTVSSWRWVGILMVAAGILVSGMVLRRKLPLLGLVVFFFLLLTDITVLLATRHDWGPVALALSLRLVFIASWIAGETSAKTSLRNSMLLGAIVGLSLFEKLSNVVLLVPLGLMLLLSDRRRHPRHIGAIVAGLVLGAMPLILTNLYTIVRYGGPISFLFPEVRSLSNIPTLPQTLAAYLSLGAGTFVRSFILGTAAGSHDVIEMTLLAVLLLVVACAFVVTRPALPRGRLSAILLLSYAGIGVALVLLPFPTWVHHWVLVTPFQYAAIAMLVSDLSEAPASPPSMHNRRLAAVCVLLLVPLFLLRMYSFVSLQQSLLRGDASRAWDPSLTKVGQFAAAESSRAVFIAADWRLSLQMLCFLNGAPGVVLPLDPPDGASKTIVDFVEESRRSVFYVVFSEPLYPGPPEARSRMLHELEGALPGGWQRLPLDEELVGLRSVWVVKYGMVPDG